MDINHVDLDKLTSAELFDLSVAIRKRLVKRAKQKQFVMTMRPAGYIHIPPFNEQTPNYLTKKIPKWIAKNRSYVRYSGGSGNIFVYDPDIRLGFVKMFYEHLRDENGEPLKLNTMLTYKE